MASTNEGRDSSGQAKSTSNRAGTREIFDAWSDTWESWYQDKIIGIDHLDLQRRLQVASGMLTKARAAMPGPVAVVDVGCGAGNGTACIAAEDVIIYAIDFAPGMVRTARKQYPHLHACEADAVKMPFQSKSFDLALSLGTIEYIPAHLAVLREFRRILKPGGVLILSIPNRTSLFRRLHRLERAVTRPVRQIARRLLRDTYEETSGRAAYYHESWSIREISHLLSHSGFEVKESQAFTFGLLWPAAETWELNVSFCQWMNDRCVGCGWLANALGCTSVIAAQAI